MNEQQPNQDILFDVETPLGFHVRTTVNHWNLITMMKHPVLREREADVRATLGTPDEIRLSKSDPNVYLVLPRRWRETVGLCSCKAPQR